MRERLVYLDETGFNLAMTRAVARAPRGQRCYGSVPKNWGDNITLTAGIRLDGLVAPMLMAGSMNGDIFEAYVRDWLLPELKPGDVVLLDNLSAHKRTAIKQILRTKDVALVFLPPYSPEYNPIELCWNKIKTLVRQLAPRTRDALADATALALRAVSAADCLAWFDHASAALLRPEPKAQAFS